MKKIRKPARIDITKTKEIRSLSIMLLQDANLSSTLPIDNIFAVDSISGRYKVTGFELYDDAQITIPIWAYSRGLDYVIYYISHELAHGFAAREEGKFGHGPLFMKWFKIICPKEYWYRELNYKPRLAAAAGISQPKK